MCSYAVFCMYVCVCDKRVSVSVSASTSASASVSVYRLFEEHIIQVIWSFIFSICLSIVFTSPKFHVRERERGRGRRD